MVTGHRYRAVSGAGVALLTVAAVLVANTEGVQNVVVSTVPVAERLRPVVLSGEDLVFRLVLVTGIVTALLAPLYKPRPRRILNTIFRAERRVFVAGLGLATVGYFDHSSRVPRATLLVTFGLLAIAIPLWLVAIRHRPTDDPERALIIGDDPVEIGRITSAIDAPIVGYVAPPTPYSTGNGDDDGMAVAATDGAGLVRERPAAGVNVSYLGGLSRLESIFVDYDVDTAVFAFNETDREEFFGVLATCHEFGVDAKIHREKADTVLVSDTPGQEILDIDVEPWDWQDRVVKRAFDVAFAGFGLLVASPLLALIAVAIKLDSPGPVFYSQERTAEFGETFTVYKFRSMIPDAESKTGVKLSEEDAGGRDPRVTRVGRILRKTHFDEIPQLWSILVGDMSVVGPRPERPELDEDIEREEGVTDWRRRWFVRPGLTGLAQINDVTGHEPEQKLRYDVEYIRRQSFRVDVAIVIRQIWKVLGDLVETVLGRD
ncbi:sugar transferase [Halapricum hydrolyticum]|uniref:Sugar transferase n=1 Tax=Halapricum hydrolyticum TaxID=2979991 RepID=A0AAE3I9L8_9EURY|nr:sugar transferase [Halapricum hydrolyticum]MCU4718165.1 sugar transferase [Halapricum hydrolyticum]MCU4726415.1 sugar transferase [Halapricum hydrolyticum]